MKLIGLTGGIGSGKSTVSEYLISKGYHVLDADAISKEIVEPGSPILRDISKIFGNAVLTDDGKLDRKAMSAIIFSNEEYKKKLDDIMHKEVINITLKRAEKIFEKCPEAVVFIDAPLLFEAGVDKYTEQNWVVDADDEVRIKRVIDRSGLSREEIERRIANQMSRGDRIAKGTHILDNSGDKEHLFEQVDKLLNQLE